MVRGWFYRGVSLKSGTPPTRIGEGITENGDTSPWDEREGPTEMGETNTESTYRDYNTDYPINPISRQRGHLRDRLNMIF